MPPGGRAFDRTDFPVEKTVYALCQGSPKESHSGSPIGSQCGT
jgi:hypothetical protein